MVGKVLGKQTQSRAGRTVKIDCVHNLGELIVTEFLIITVELVRNPMVHVSGGSHAERK